MPTKLQMKGIAIKTAIVTGIDKGLYSQSLDVKQGMMDMSNFAITEYVTKSLVDKQLGSMLTVVPPEQRDLLIAIVLDVVQDMIMQRVVSSRKRNLVESAVAFSVAEFGGDQLQQRFPMLS